jgi:ABC-type branched-subunit amino acid transport system substrate-binding protein
MGVNKLSVSSYQWSVWKRFYCLLFTVYWLLASCVPSTKPSLKITLVGPFEGRYRDVGIEVIYAARLAIREANVQGGVGGYTVELMGFDDGGDPDQAMMQAKKVATDSQVVAAVGNWLPSTTQAAAAVYDRVGIPFVAISEPLSPTSPLDPSFVDRYKKISQGVEPNFLAAMAYDATKIILQAIERDVKANGKPTRLGVAAALAQTDTNGLSGRITFDAKQNSDEGKRWVYKWEEGKIKRP